MSGPVGGAGIGGVGVVGGFGSGVGALTRALEAGPPTPARVPLRLEGREIEVPVFRADPTGLERFVPKRALRRVDRFSRLALLAGHLALEDAGRLEADRSRLGLVVATGYGATATTFSFLDSFLDGGDALASPTLFSNSVHNAAAASLSIQLGITGPNLTVSQFEMSVPSALLAARGWLAEGRVEAVLFGGVDEYGDVLGYCRHRFFGVADDGPDPFRPEDLAGQTAVAGEGAAFFVLTRAGDGPAPYGRLEDLVLGRVGPEGIPIPSGAAIFFGADGHRRCGEGYARLAPEGARTYARYYGSLPVGPAFDLAVAAVSARAGRLFAPAAGAPAEPLDGRPIACVKLGGEGEFAVATVRGGGDR